jgi:c-di-GMP-binding flagellar brake protein YcgR
MLDLSAGGLSVDFPREVRPRWREQDQLSCRFAAGPDRTPVEVSARLTHYSREADGHVRLGLQFLGLDTCEQGRHVLQQIHHMANRLQRFRKNKH